MIWPASTHLRSSSVFLSRIWSLSLNEGWLWLSWREVIRAPAAQGDGKPPRWDFSPRWRPCCRPGSTMEGASGSLPCSSVRRNVAGAVPWCSCFHVAAEFRAEDAECIFCLLLWALWWNSAPNTSCFILYPGDWARLSIWPTGSSDGKDPLLVCLLLC